MTDNAAAPVAQELENPLALHLPMFQIDTPRTLQQLMMVERRAIELVNQKGQTFMEPGMQLVGQDGKPIREVGMKLNQKMTDYLHELLQNPTLAESWGSMGGPESLNRGLDISSYKIAYISYAEWSRLVQITVPPLVDVVDALMLIGLNAIKHHASVVEVWSANIKPKPKDDVTGAALLGIDAQFNAMLKAVYARFVAFLSTKRLLANDDSNSQDIPEALELNEAGLRFTEHLLAVMGISQSMAAQGPAIMEQIMADQGQTKTGENIAADMDWILSKNNAKFPEA